MDQDKGTARGEGSETLVLQVEGMSCTGCEQRIGNTLRRVDGVREVTADHTTGRVDVRVDQSVAPATLASRIAKAGYRVPAYGEGVDDGEDTSR